jgi:predicted nucleic-acid-binding Zn-ribbon protein
MKQTGTCPKCGSGDIVPWARGFSGPRYLSLVTFSKPHAAIFKGTRSSSLSAFACGSCGYVEFYADAPAQLKADSTSQTPRWTAP